MRESIICVCYADPTKQEGFVVVRVPWADRNILCLTDVLHISIIISGHKKRRQSSSFHDFYQLIWDENETECCLTGHDGDYGFYSLTDPSKQPDWRFPFVMPKNCIEFEGVYVDKETWKKSLLVYADPNGRMF